MPIKIKRITTKSLNGYFSFFRKNFPLLFREYSEREVKFILTGRWGWSKKRYRELLADHDRIILAAFDLRKIVCILDAELPDFGVSECEWVMVHKDYQGKGIGKALLKEWEAIVKKSGGHSLYLDSRGTNASLYIKRGFTLLGLYRKGWFGKNTYIFTRQIQKPNAKNYLK